MASDAGFFIFSSPRGLSLPLLDSCRRRSVGVRSCPSLAPLVNLDFLFIPTAIVKIEQNRSRAKPKFEIQRRLIEVIKVIKVIPERRDRLGLGNIVGYARL